MGWASALDLKYGPCWLCRELSDQLQFRIREGGHNAMLIQTKAGQWVRRCEMDRICPGLAG